MQFNPDKFPEYEAIKKVKDFYEQLISLLPGHVYWKDRNGRYLGCNELQARNIGLSSKRDIIGKTDHELSSSKEAESLRKTDIEVMESGVPRVLEEKKFSKTEQKLFIYQKKCLLKMMKGILLVF